MERREARISEVQVTQLSVSGKGREKSTGCGLSGSGYTAGPPEVTGDADSGVCSAEDIVAGAAVVLAQRPQDCGDSQDCWPFPLASGAAISSAEWGCITGLHNRAPSPR